MSSVRVHMCPITSPLVPSSAHIVLTHILHFVPDVPQTQVSVCKPRVVYQGPQTIPELCIIFASVFPTVPLPGSCMMVSDGISHTQHKSIPFRYVKLTPVQCCYFTLLFLPIFGHIFPFPVYWIAPFPLSLSLLI